MCKANKVSKWYNNLQSVLSFVLKNINLAKYEVRIKEDTMFEATIIEAWSADNEKVWCFSWQKGWSGYVELEGKLIK